MLWPVCRHKGSTIRVSAMAITGKARATVALGHGPLMRGELKAAAIYIDRNSPVQVGRIALFTPQLVTALSG